MNLVQEELNHMITLKDRFTPILERMFKIERRLDSMFTSTSEGSDIENQVVSIASMCSRIDKLTS